MGIRVFLLLLLRLLLFIFSAATIACHIAQLVLLENTQWWPKNYAYILYIVGPGFSTLSSLGLLITLKKRSIKADRLLGPINLALMIATIVIGTLKSGPVPWTSSSTWPDTIGFQSSCSTFRTDMRLYQRCWLSNGMWLGSIVLGAFWLMLVLHVFIQRSHDIYADEYEVYDFKPSSSPGVAITSPSPVLDHHHTNYYDPGYTTANTGYDPGYTTANTGYDPGYTNTGYDHGHHRYYEPALAVSTPTSDFHQPYYPHQDTTHIIPSPPSSKSVPHSYI